MKENLLEEFLEAEKTNIVVHNKSLGYSGARSGFRETKIVDMALELCCALDWKIVPSFYEASFEFFKKQKADFEKQERADYERLKLKFEGTDET